jgi:hypothetical protein
MSPSTARGTRLRHALAALALACGLGGCSVLQGGKLFAPETAGLERIAPDVYVEAGADAATRQEVLDAVARAQQAVRSAFGSVRAQPIFHACISEGCYERFGGRGSTAKVYGDHVLLSPRGLSWHFAAHEWAHAEMFKRLQWRALWALPRWFDEGVAVAVSEAPEHSETHWALLQSMPQVRRPEPQQLRALQTLGQWYEALREYGDDTNLQRRARGEQETHVVYTAAGHELRPWLAAHGTAGLLALLDGLNAGEPFNALYAAPAP